MVTSPFVGLGRNITPSSGFCASGVGVLAPGGFV